MQIIHAIVMAFVEGVSEFLPISSTGHLILTAKLMGLAQTNFLKTFEVVIQLGAILAVVFLYGKRVIANKAIWWRLLWAFIPTVLVGATFYKTIKEVLMTNVNVTLMALFVGGIILIVIDRFLKDKSKQSMEKFTIVRALLIGVFQSLSVVPGVSRAAATIIGGRVMGLSRKDAVEFSFLLAVPTMLAASGFDLLKSEISWGMNEVTLLVIGFIGSFITALLVIKWFVSFSEKYSMAFFGVYRIVLAMVYWWFLGR